ICETFSFDLVQKFGRDLKNAEFYEAFKVFFIKPHVADLANIVGIDLENTSLYEVFHAKIRETGRLHFRHELRSNIKNAGFEQVVHVERAEICRKQIIDEGGGQIYRGRCKKAVFEGRTVLR